MPSYRLHAVPGNFRTCKTLVAARYAGVDVEVVPHDAARIRSLSPTGKGPLLEVLAADPGSGSGCGSCSETTTNNTILFGSTAIARYVARIRSDAGLMGDGSPAQMAAVDGWMEFCDREIELPATVWTYPVCGYLPYREAAYGKAKTDLGAALAVVERHLAAEEGGRAFLVGNRLTLADIALVAALVHPFRLVCDPAFLGPYPNVVRWFAACVAQREFKDVVGDVELCKKESLAKR